MGNRYSSNSASGYNATPPADDGTVSEANKGKWSTIKTKLSDPVKDLADAINTDLATHFDNGPVALTTNTTIAASHYNQVIQASGASVTLTLTAASTLTAGWYCDIISTDTTNTITIARASASDMINETTANISLLPLQHIRAVVNAAANGFLISTQGRHSKTYQNGEVQRNTAQVRWSKGADIASASALTLGTDGNYFDITGTTSITSIGTVGIGTLVKLHFDAALTLTHHATDLILPGGENIVTAAGDEAEFIEYASGDWQCTKYTRASNAEFTIASAGTTDLRTTSSDNVYITGTTTITALGTVAAGIVKKCRFASALTLTHNGTSLILPSSANITTAANDVAEFMSLGSGNWICRSYNRIDGASVISGMFKIAGATNTNVATIDITGLTSSYDNYLLVIQDLKTLAGGTTVLLRFSTDGGSTFNSGYYVLGTASSSSITLATTDDAGSSVSADLKLINMNSTDTDEHTVIGQVFMKSNLSEASNVSNQIFAASDANLAAAVNAIRLLAGTGNLTATWKLFGFKNS